ncbi:MAG: hypothetical protein AB8C02_00065 [Halioglobus sp.]
MLRLLHMTLNNHPHRNKPGHVATTPGHDAAHRDNVAAHQDTTTTHQDSNFSPESTIGPSAESERLFTLAIPEVRKMLVEAGHVVSERTVLRWCEKELLHAALRPEENGQYEKYYVSKDSVIKKICQLDRVRPTKASSHDVEANQDTTATKQDTATTQADQTNENSEIASLKIEIQELKSEMLTKDVDVKIRDKLLIREKEATREAWNKIAEVGEQVGEWKAKYEQLELASPTRPNPVQTLPKYHEVEFKQPSSPTQTNEKDFAKNSVNIGVAPDAPTKTQPKKRRDNRPGAVSRYLLYTVIVAISVFTTLAFL